MGQFEQGATEAGGQCWGLCGDVLRPASQVKKKETSGMRQMRVSKRKSLDKWAS